MVSVQARAGGDTGREEREVSDWGSFPQEDEKTRPAESELIVC